MKRTHSLLLVLAFALLLVSVGARQTVAGPLASTAKVVRVVDGDTVDVRFGAPQPALPLAPGVSPPPVVPRP